jgi:lipid A disaccharide synthetase
MHCANLVDAIQDSVSANAVWPGEDVAQATEYSTAIRFSGFGGQRLAEAGCELLDDTVSKAAMHYDVLGQLGYYKKLIKQANAFFE